MDVLIERDQQQSMLDTIISAQYQTTTILLVKANLPEDETTDIAAVIANEADFTGYARLTGINFTSPPLFDQNGVAVSESGLLVIASSGSTITNTVYGFAVVDAAVAVLLGYEVFPAPFQIDLFGQAVAFVARIPWKMPAIGAMLTNP